MNYYQCRYESEVYLNELPSGAETKPEEQPYVYVDVVYKTPEESPTEKETEMYLTSCAAYGTNLHRR